MLPHRRKPFSKETQRQALERSKRGGTIPRCESVRVPSIAEIDCARQLRSGDINFDHIQANANNGDNSLENCAVLCRICHSIKTREHDVPAIAQDKRVFDLHHGIEDPHRQRLPGGRDSPFKIKLKRREVVLR